MRSNPARWEAVEQKKSGCLGPANIGPVIGWFTSVSFVRSFADRPGPGTRASSVLGPSGSPFSTPSSACGARSSAANEEVTFAPFNSILAAASGTDTGTTTRTRAAPPLTYCAGPDSTSSRSAPWRPGGGPRPSVPAAAGTAATSQAAANAATTGTWRFMVSSLGLLRVAYAVAAAKSSRTGGFGTLGRPSAQAAERFRDALDLVVTQLRIKRHAQDAFAQSFRDGERNRAVREPPVRGVPVDRRRVMDQGLDAGFLQMRPEGVAIRRVDDEQVEDMASSLELRERSHARVGQRLRVHRCDLGTALVPAQEVRKPRSQNRGLQLVKAAVDTGGNVTVTVGLTVLTHEPQALGEGLVIRHDCATVAERGEVLRWIEAEAAKPADRPRGTPSQLRAGSLGAVLHDVDAALGAEGCDRVGFRTLTVQMDRHDRARLLTERSGERGRVHRPGFGLDVAENGSCTSALDCRHSWHARVRLGHDLVPRADPESAQRQLDRVRPRSDADGVRRAGR